MTGLSHVGPEGALPFPSPVACMPRPCPVPAPTLWPKTPCSRPAAGRRPVGLSLSVAAQAQFKKAYFSSGEPFPSTFPAQLPSPYPSANSVSTGSVLALVPRKPGKGHTPEKPPAESKLSHYLLLTPEALLGSSPC